jgi:cytochrome c peroxidase
MTGIRCLLFVIPLACAAIEGRAECSAPEVGAGSAIFRATTLSADGKTSCATCHDPIRQFASDRDKAVGAGGLKGTRNAPSLVYASESGALFWDGRRIGLDQTVLDAFTNPVELGLPSNDELIARISRLRLKNLSSPQPTLQEISGDLTCYIRSLASHRSRFDDYLNSKRSLTDRERNGLELFRGVAGCAECHRVDGNIPRFTDNAFHHSGVQQEPLQKQMGELAAQVIASNTPPDKLGEKILRDPLWSAAGRFVVTHEPKDMGSFKTPSLRNVAETAPYMHDGSVPTLREAVDREIYYRAFSTGRVVNLTDKEREDIMLFLQSLSDQPSTRQEKGP